MDVSHAMPNSNNGSLAVNLGITMYISNMTATTGDTVSLVISSASAMITTYKGVLLFAEGVSGKHSEGWTYNDGFGNPSACSEVGPSLGHTSGSKKTFPVTFVWRVPALSQFASDSFTFKGIVVVDKYRWGTVNPITIKVNQVRFYFALPFLQTQREYR
jgi:hypothetical protein